MNEKQLKRILNKPELLNKKIGIKIKYNAMKVKQINYFWDNSPMKHSYYCSGIRLVKRSAMRG